jgi:hypothetical protein
VNTPLDVWDSKIQLGYNILKQSLRLPETARNPDKCGLGLFFGLPKMVDCLLGEYGTPAI